MRRASGARPSGRGSSRGAAAPARRQCGGMWGCVWRVFLHHDHPQLVGPTDDRVKCVSWLGHFGPHGGPEGVLRCTAVIKIILIKYSQL